MLAVLYGLEDPTHFGAAKHRGELSLTLGSGKIQVVDRSAKDSAEQELDRVQIHSPQNQVHGERVA